MWVPVHRRVKTRRIAGGASFTETCPECRAVARFEPIEVSESFGAVFVDLLGDTEQRYRCSACGNEAGFPVRPLAPIARAMT
jgi:rubredoxin